MALWPRGGFDRRLALRLRPWKKRPGMRLLCVAVAPASAFMHDPCGGVDPLEAASGWFQVADADSIPSPALLVYRERVQANIRKMLAIAGSPDRLRPHIKTHKMPEVIRLQLEQGIRKFKAATIAEAEMAAAAGAPDVLLALQPVGPQVGRLLQLMNLFPSTRFSTVADDAGVLEALSAGAAAHGQTLDVLLDLDPGMHRSGIAPGEPAFVLYDRIGRLPGLRRGGLHVFDGHLNAAVTGGRQQVVEASFAPVRAFRQHLESSGLEVPRMVVGGTPTFPAHAATEGAECSPGTCVFSDWRYATNYPQDEFRPAALVLTRVTSKPAAGRLCLDLGHKGIAAESPPPRVHLYGLPDAREVIHSEEHLVVETARADEFKVGDVLYGLPLHICPTVALYSEAVVVSGGRDVARWEVTARQRRITV